MVKWSSQALDRHWPTLTALDLRLTVIDLHNTVWNGWYMNGSDKISQDFYFPNDHPEFPGWFKGMENIICEHGLWPNESDFEAIKNKSKICLNDLFILLKQSFL